MNYSAKADSRKIHITERNILLKYIIYLDLDLKIMCYWIIKIITKKSHVMSKTTISFEILATNLSFLYNYFDGSKIIF